jgi:hypothetical protein
MAWHDVPPWTAKRAESEELMQQVAEVVRRWHVRRISGNTAVEKVRELLEPLRVRVGKAHEPEVQS